MFEKIRERISKLLTSEDEQKLVAAESDFDDRMAEVEGDIADLTKLEKHVREEFDEINGDIKDMSEEIDEVVEKEPTTVGK
jgi:hypothetical protein